MRAAGDLLARALELRGTCRILASRERPWASATFTGTRHRLRMTLADPAFLEGIEEDVFDLGEYLLADLAVIERLETGEGLAVVIDALTIEDRRDSVFVATSSGRTEAEQRMRCGTKRAFVPLAAA